MISQTDHSAVLGMEVANPRPPLADNAPVEQGASDETLAPVKMVVVDGIVMGHTVSFTMVIMVLSSLITSALWIS